MMMDPRADWRRLAFVLLLALMAYANSFRAGLVFDNLTAIADDARVQSATWRNVTALVTQDYWSPSTTSWLYRPLTKLSYLFNYSLLGSGANPFSYHVLNFLLHALNIVLVYLLGLTLFRERERADFLALGMAAIWAVHPVLTEDITNIVGRADLLAATGVLAGLLCHIRGRWLGLLALFATVGIFSKENAIALIAVMAVYDLSYRPGTWKARIPNYLAVAVPFALYFVLRQQYLSPVLEKNEIFADNPLLGADFWTARLTAMGVLGKYLWLLIWPANLSADYAYNQIPLSGWNWQAIAAIAVYLGIAMAACFYLRRRKEIFFLAAFFLLCLAPMSNVFLIIGTIMGERFLYLPAIAFAGIVVLAIEVLFRRSPKAALAAIALICVTFAARTFWRNFDWQTEQSLWASTVQTSPDSYRAHMARAYWMMRDNSGDKPAIAREVDRSVAILDSLPDSRNEVRPFMNAGYWYRTQGDGQRALALYLRAKRIDDVQGAEFTRRNQAQGKSVPKQGQPQLYLELGRTYELLHDQAKAIDALNYGRMLNPDPAFTQEIAAIYRSAGDKQAAAVALMEGLMLDLRQAGFTAELVDLYRKNMPDSCAVQGNGINLSCAVVRDHACTASAHVFHLHRDAGRSVEASQVAGTAVRDLGCPAENFR